MEVINDLAELLQMYSTQILNQPELASEYKAKQAEQVLYYERIIRNIDIYSSAI